MSDDNEVGRAFLVTATPIDAAAARLADTLRSVGLGARLAISGGSAAAALGPLRRLLPAPLWQSLRVTWIDERRVAFDSPASNRGSAHRAGWLGPEAPVSLELPLYLDGESGSDAAGRVARALAEQLGGALDVLLLGLGEDGHIASLFPGHAALESEAPVVLVEDSPKPPPKRITLTLPVLRTARTAVLIATGEAKRAALARLHAGDTSLPASTLPRLLVVTDLAVAESLTTNP